MVNNTGEVFESVKEDHLEREADVVKQISEESIEVMLLERELDKLKA